MLFRLLTASLFFIFEPLPDEIPSADILKGVFRKLKSVKFKA
jgi:hypothetical protein